jgi:uncharacterized protein YraI
MISDHRIKTANAKPMFRNTVSRARLFSSPRKLLSFLMMATALTISVGGPTIASAASSGVAVTAVNMRAGPSTQYPVVIVMPGNASLAVYGCMADGSWCDISWGGARGWVSASYIHVFYKGQPTVLSASIVPVVGIATVEFNIAYWDTHYHSKSWYGHWDRYNHSASRKVVAGCNGNGCGAAAVTRGPHGGGRAAVVGGNNGNVGGAAVTRGPNGAGRAAVGGCGPEKCAGASVTRGPRGNTAIRHGSVDRP